MGSGVCVCLCVGLAWFGSVGFGTDMMGYLVGALLVVVGANVIKGGFIKDLDKDYENFIPTLKKSSSFLCKRGCTQTLVGIYNVFS